MIAKRMAKIASAYAFFAILFSIAIAISPDFIASSRDFFVSESGRYVSVIVNSIMGVVFLMAVPAVRVPAFLQIIGAYALVEALVTLLLPLDTWSGMVDFWLVENLALYRTVGAAIGVVVFGFVLYITYPAFKGANES